MKDVWVIRILSFVCAFLAMVTVMSIIGTMNREVEITKLETKLAAIDAICYSNVYENPQMWAVMDIIVDNFRVLKAQE